MCKHQKSTTVCPECHGKGEVWVCWNEGGFERGRYWENCRVCDGGWKEPKPEEEEEDTSGCHTTE